MRILKRSGALALTLAAALMSSGAWAESASPVGLWRNVDDVSGKPRAFSRVTESNGTLQGKIEKVFRAPSEDRNPKCEKCEGALKDVPVIGLVILSGPKKDGAEYAAGKILDPDNGKVYSSKIQLTDGAKNKKPGSASIETAPDANAERPAAAEASSSGPFRHSVQYCASALRADASVNHHFSAHGRSTTSNAQVDRCCR